MPHKILIYPDPRLYEKAEKVEKFGRSLRDFVREMFEIMKKEKGIGLAATQLGVKKRVIVIDLLEMGGPRLSMINPRIIDTSSEKFLGEEGCLSIPGVYAQVERHKKIQVEYQDLSGRKHKIEAEDLSSRVIQHEIDHLDGILFISRISPSEKERILPLLQMLERGEIPQVEKKPSYERYRVG